jgi:threonine/homoserine/homoserine lactone efflux protein
VSIEFLVTSLIVVATPGTGVLYTLAAGLSRGMRASTVAAFGCTLGIIPHMAAAILGLAALLHASALAFQTLKYLGVVYLLYMAWNTLREQGALTVETDVDPRSTRQVIVSAILIAAMNPCPCGSCGDPRRVCTCAPGAIGRYQIKKSTGDQR